MKVFKWVQATVCVILRFAPLLAIMATIFYFSSLPSENVPHIDYFDVLLKKGGHFIGYALLASAALRALGRGVHADRLPVAIFCLLYAISDEFHQSFVHGRFASPIDVMIDMAGVLTALWLLSRSTSMRRLVFWDISNSVSKFLVRG